MGKGIFSLFNSLRDNQSGNIFFTMFGAVALVGAVGAASMTVMKGPVRSMSEVTKRTIAENNMMASAKLAVMGATSGMDGGDCDGDGMIEPVPFDTATMPAPSGGGHLPAAIGASLQDPWQNRYGYCVWDHGAVTKNASCDVGGENNRLAGINQQNQITIAVISAGPDRIFQTSCITAAAADAAGNGNNIVDDDEHILVRVPGSDDIIHSYTYAEANTAGGGLWNLKAGDQGTAQISKNLEVKDSGGSTTFSLDSQTGIGEFMAIKTDSIQSKTPNASVAMDSPVRFYAPPGVLPPPEGGAAGGGGGGGGGGGSDNLGDHTATEDLNMASFNIIGAGTVTAAAYLHSSDRNLKDNIIDINDPFALLTAIHGKHYIWKKNGVAAYGVIAQDVETVMPEAVSTDANGVKAVEYDQLIAPLIEAVKQLRDDNESLRKEIDALKDAR